MEALNMHGKYLTCAEVRNFCNGHTGDIRITNSHKRVYEGTFYSLTQETICVLTKDNGLVRIPLDDISRLEK